MLTVCLFAVQRNEYVSFVYRSKKDFKRCRLENFVFFCIRYFSKIKSNPAKKFSEQCFFGKTKPTCQNSDTKRHQSIKKLTPLIKKIRKPCRICMVERLLKNNGQLQIVVVVVRPFINKYTLQPIG